MLWEAIRLALLAKIIEETKKGEVNRIPMWLYDESHIYSDNAIT